MKTVANGDAQGYVQKRIEFKGSHTFARERHTDHSTLYIVYSYGEHYPMFIAETGDDDGNNITRWYENSDKSSLTTERHKSQLRPQVEQTEGQTEGQTIVPMDTRRMHLLAIGGLMEVIARGAS